MPTDPKDIDPAEKYRKCDGCLKPRAELDAPLLQCSACRMVSCVSFLVFLSSPHAPDIENLSFAEPAIDRYCSKECQRSDWKVHKPRCKVNQDHHAAINDNSFMTRLAAQALPDGLTLAQYDQRLEEWISVWSFTMCEAAIHAMRVPQDQKRCRTHVLHVTLKGRPHEEHKGNMKYYFEVTSAIARPIVEARKRYGEFQRAKNSNYLIFLYA